MHTYTITLTMRCMQAIRQTVRIIAMDHPQGILRTGDRATVTFEFISHPEFLKEGMKLLFREGKTKVRNLAIPSWKYGLMCWPYRVLE